jgi:hypothetical protein
MNKQNIEKIIEKVFKDLFHKDVKAEFIKDIVILTTESGKDKPLRCENKNTHYVFYRKDPKQEIYRWIFIKKDNEEVAEVKCEVYRKDYRENTDKTKDELRKQVRRNRTLCEDIIKDKEQIGIIVEQKNEILFWTRLYKDNLESGRIEDLREYKMEKYSGFGL